MRVLSLFLHTAVIQRVKLKTHIGDGCRGVLLANYRPNSHSITGSFSSAHMRHHLSVANLTAIDASRARWASLCASLGLVGDRRAGTKSELVRTLLRALADDAELQGKFIAEVAESDLFPDVHVGDEVEITRPAEIEIVLPVGAPPAADAAANVLPIATSPHPTGASAAAARVDPDPLAHSDSDTASIGGGNRAARVLADFRMEDNTFSLPNDVF